jgi:hypothetical protein
MVERESLKSAVATPRSEDTAEFERTAAAVILKTCGNWMLRTFVPLPPVNGRVSKVRSSANVRSASCNLLT